MNGKILNEKFPELKINNKQNNHSDEEMILMGIPSSPGLAMGKAYVIEPEDIIIPNKKINQDEIPDELIKFDSAVNELNNEFQVVLEKVKKEASNVTSVLETNILILNDSILLDSIKKQIEKGFSVESSVLSVFDKQIKYLKIAKDTILKERAIELDNIKHRMLTVLRDRCVSYSIEKNTIIVAKSLTTTDIVSLKELGVLAIVTEVGGISSHSSILARSFNIPAVIGVKDATKIIDSGSDLIIDGFTGEIVIDPSNMSIGSYNIKKVREKEHQAQLGDIIGLESDTVDGRHIKLMSNIDFPEDVEQAVLVKAEGIGLVRSENLIILMGRFPTEDEQYNWYNQMSERAYPNPVTIRAFDVGSDKYAEGMPKHENNPALGFRGIRFLLSRRDLFKSQVKAVLRASSHKNIKFMLPMITNIMEVRTALTIIDDCKKCLDKENLDYDHNLPIGVMIETPAAALITDQLADLISFFSIGTNDLTQYTLAADRTNDFVADYYYPFHPGVLRLIKITVDAAIKKGIELSICGELASHAAATSLLIGMGIDELSVNPSVLLELKKRVRETEYPDAIKLAEDVMQCSDYSDIARRLRN